MAVGPGTPAEVLLLVSASCSILAVQGAFGAVRASISVEVADTEHRLGFYALNSGVIERLAASHMVAPGHSGSTSVDQQTLACCAEHGDEINMRSI